MGFYNLFSSQVVIAIKMMKIEGALRRYQKNRTFESWLLGTLPLIIVRIICFDVRNGMCKIGSQEKDYTCTSGFLLIKINYCPLL